MNRVTTIADRQAIAEMLLEDQASSRDQEVADVMTAVVRRRVVRTASSASVTARRATSSSGCLEFLASSSTEWRYRSRVGKSIRPVRPRRIVAQDLFDQADALEKQRPVCRRQQPHAADDVADPDLVRRLAIVLAPDHLVRRILLGLERPMQRFPRGRGRRGLIAEPLQELDDERCLEAPGLPAGFAKRTTDHLLGLGHRIGEDQTPAARRLATAVRFDDVACEDAQFLHQREPQHDGDRPDFADRERGAALIRDDKADQRLEIEPAGRVYDQLARQHVDTGVALERPVRQLGQLEVVAPRQILSERRGSDPGRRESCRGASLPSRPAWVRRGSPS